MIRVLHFGKELHLFDSGIRIETKSQEFNSSGLKQLCNVIGAAMGTPPTPSNHMKYGENKISASVILKNNLVGIFQILLGKTKQSHSFIDEINEIHQI